MKQFEEILGLDDGTRKMRRRSENQSFGRKPETFKESGFYEVETPVLESVTGGADAKLL